jgi:hypothetical protein
MLNASPPDSRIQSGDANLDYSVASADDVNERIFCIIVGAPNYNNGRQAKAVPMYNMVHPRFEHQLFRAHKLIRLSAILDTVYA